MTPELLVQMGLTPSQAKSYLELVKAGSLTPPELAKRTNESRTAAYMALGKLTEIGLAKQAESVKKQTYLPVSPSALSQFLSKRRQELAATEEAFKDKLPTLLSYYYTHRGKPGIRFYEGETGLQEIYKDHLRTKQKVYVLRTSADEEFGNVLYDYLEKRAGLNIPAEMLSPALPGTMSFSAANDKRLKRTSAWIPPEHYTAPVEVSIYGNKVSMISFGEEAVGVIIESPQIAEAMNQLYKLAKSGAKALIAEEEKK